MVPDWLTNDEWKAVQVMRTGDIPEVDAQPFSYWLNDKECEKVRGERGDKFGTSLSKDSGSASSVSSLCNKSGSASSASSLESTNFGRVNSVAITSLSNKTTSVSSVYGLDKSMIQPHLL